MKEETFISKRACRRLIKNFTGKRVGDETAEALRSLLEDVAEEISIGASHKAEYADRKTVKPEDIELEKLEFFNR